MEHPSFDPEIQTIVETILQQQTDISELAELAEREYQSESTTDMYSYLAQNIKDHIYSVYGKISDVINAEILPLKEVITAMRLAQSHIDQDEFDDVVSFLLTHAAKQWHETASAYDKAIIFGQSYDKEDGVTYLISLLRSYIDPAGKSL